MGIEIEPRLTHQLFDEAVIGGFQQGDDVANHCLLKVPCNIPAYVRILAEGNNYILHHLRILSQQAAPERLQSRRGAGIQRLDQASTTGESTGTFLQFRLPVILPFCLRGHQLVRDGAVEQIVATTVTCRRQHLLVQPASTCTPVYSLQQSIDEHGKALRHKHGQLANELLQESPALQPTRLVQQGKLQQLGPHPALNAGPGQPIGFDATGKYRLYGLTGLARAELGEMLHEQPQHAG